MLGGPQVLQCVLWAGLLVVQGAWGSDLTILHTNDLHSRFDEITGRGSQCRDKDRRAGQCFGGVARIKYAVDQIRDETNGNMVFVNGGDFFQGTVWYSMFKWRIVANLTADLGYTASSLGNHEFDDGVPDLINFAAIISPHYPLLACNLDLTREPLLNGKIKGSIVVVVDNRKIGIVGYVTPDTKDLASVGKVVFLDEIESIRKEMDSMKSTHPDLNIFIGLGHSGYKMDQKIAQEVEGLDVVVGGHTNTFLWTMNATGHPIPDDNPMGPYPTEIIQPSGQKCLVVQTSGYGKYIGRLNVQFDESGQVVAYTGKPVLLDQSKSEDPYLKRLVGAYRNRVAEKMDTIVGATDVLIDGGRPKCRLEECSFGNFVTDAMASEMGVEMALINSGGIKGSFQTGDVTMGDVFTAMPWSNTIDVIEIPGSILKEVLEYSVSEYDPDHSDPSGRFLQYSGLIVYYDTTQPSGQRLVDAYEGTPEQPEFWARIEDEATYELAVLSFMARGGDGYQMIPDHLLAHKNTGYLDNDLIVRYLAKRSPVSEPQMGRIRFGAASSFRTSGSTVLSTSRRDTVRFIFEALVATFSLHTILWD
eukprot:maker-scaffold172_size289735-snap-gene-1.31 protein:Tk06521 transcript:maker-scaffold172_size289735-snap-gene-1.31-mRNA-1 annotation:"hypothetical protein DAPPUDRAFT_42388"